MSYIYLGLEVFCPSLAVQRWYLHTLRYLMYVPVLLLNNPAAASSLATLLCFAVVHYHAATPYNAGVAAAQEGNTAEKDKGIETERRSTNIQKIPN
jgi:hypothetical protein